MSTHTSQQQKSIDRPASFCTTNCANGVLVVRPTDPSLGQDEAPAVCDDAKQALNDASADVQRFVLDLSAVRIMSSFGLSVCIDIRNTADSCGLPTFLVGVAPGIRELFRMTNVDRLFTIVQSLREVPKAQAS